MIEPPDSIKRVWLAHMIISGGQTGVDRAGLDWARAHGIAHGGWCPKGRVASDGPLPLMYQLKETESEGYRQRTKLNVRDSDATLVLNIGELDGGTLQTVKFAQTLRKPHRVVDLDPNRLPEEAIELVAWLDKGCFAKLNIAGPREEKRPGIYANVMLFLDRCEALAFGNRT